jgi:hypothetical protein
MARSMKKSAQAAVAALVLLLGGALGYRYLYSRSSAPLRPSPPPLAFQPSAPAVPLSVTPAGSLTLRWITFLESQLAKPPAKGAEEEITMSQERELAQELKKKLAQDPARWSDVLEVLSEEDPRIGRKIVASLGDGVDDAAEKELIRALQVGRHRETRMASTTLIGPRTSPQSLWALVAAAQEDPDSGVRFRALSELAVRKAQAAPADAATIDQLILRRAQVEPDSDVRNAALRMSGQTVAGDRPPLKPIPSSPKDMARPIPAPPK